MSQEDCQIVIIKQSPKEYSSKGNKRAGRDTKKQEVQLTINHIPRFKACNMIQNSDDTHIKYTKFQFATIEVGSRSLTLGDHN